MNAPFLLPYENSPTVWVLAGGALLLYLCGLLRQYRRPHRHGHAPGVVRVVAFIVGVGLMYFVLQTRYDYMAQHMFFIHRLQHLVLHHLAPVLIILAAPGSTLAAGLPLRARARVRRVGHWPVIVAPYRLIQQPAVAAVLFVGLIYLWLTPGIHLYAMLNMALYNVMNWSMAIDGLLFWYLMLNLRTPAQGGVRYGWRIIILVLIIFPQLAIGAYIALAHHDIYHVYAICGRLWPISPITDQRLGGLITWIPASMMSVLGALIVLHRLLAASNTSDNPSPERSYA